MWGCGSSVYPFLLWWSWECVLYRMIIIKPEVWIINHCLGLGHETIVCAVCLIMFLCWCAVYLKIPQWKSPPPPPPQLAMTFTSKEILLTITIHRKYWQTLYLIWENQYMTIPSRLIFPKTLETSPKLYEVFDVCTQQVSSPIGNVRRSIVP